MARVGELWSVEGPELGHEFFRRIASAAEGHGLSRREGRATHAISGCPERLESRRKAVASPSAHRLHKALSFLHAGRLPSNTARPRSADGGRTLRPFLVRSFSRVPWQCGGRPPGAAGFSRS